MRLRMLQTVGTNRKAYFDTMWLFGHMVQTNTCFFFFFSPNLIKSNKNGYKYQFGHLSCHGNFKKQYKTLNLISTTILILNPSPFHHIYPQLTYPHVLQNPSPSIPSLLHPLPYIFHYSSLKYNQKYINILF